MSDKCCNGQSNQNGEILKDPVCGMNVNKESKFKIEFEGKNYYFCSESCSKKFELNPIKYLKKNQLKDLVCGMKTSEESKHFTKYEGKNYYFCSNSCKTKFNNDPQSYLNKDKKKEEDEVVVSDNVIYTCPMHPEIEQNKPGDCPKCGMALESKTVTSEVDDTELKEMTKKLIISTIFAIPLLIVSMGDLIPGAPISKLFSPFVKNILELILATPICIWAAFPFYKKGVQSIKTMNLNMFTLIGLGVSVSYGYSLIAVLFPDIFPSNFKSSGGEVQVYFEAAGLIVTLILLGQVFELRARSQTGTAIKQLLGLASKTARIIKDDGNEIDIPLEDVKKGDLLRIRPGEKVPTDGVVVEGRTLIDESMITGEPVPVSKQKDDKVIGATMNSSGSLVIRAEKIGSDTMLSRIIQMVADAQRSKAPIQKLADVVAGYFVPIVIGISIITFVIWAIFGPEPKMAFALINAIAVLIIACPCALGLATPMSIMVSTGKGATMGVLFKNAEAIESLRKVNTLIVDKTGTLTLGKPVLEIVESFSGIKEDKLLYYAASLEKGSEHPHASSILNKAKEKDIKLSTNVEFEYLTGKGVVGTVDSMNVALGNNALMEHLKVDSELAEERTTELLKQGYVVMSVVVDGQLQGIIGVIDPIKETTTEAIKKLQNEGIEVVMLSGDNKITANIVAKKLGIKKVIAEVLPDEKVNVVKKLQMENKIVAMAGDGINDAPALAQADVGIAMGTGTDIAMESADLTLIKGDLNGIFKAVKLSRETMLNIKQNLFFAFIYNSVGVPVAAGVLYPFFGILLSPILAAAAMSFSSVSVITNALRLRNKEF